MTLGFLLSWTAFRQLGNSRDLPIRRKSVVLENRGMNSLEGITQPPPGDESAVQMRELLAPPRRSRGPMSNLVSAEPLT